VSKPLLQAKQITKYFTNRTLFRKKQFRAVHEVSFEVHAGEVLAIVGESGSGKSTLARMATHLLPSSEGDILYDGTSINRDKKLRKQLPTHVQMIFQDPFAALNPHHKIGYIIGRPLEVQNKGTGDVRGKVIELLTQVGLTPADEFFDKYPYELSGGQKQRVMIAKVLGLNPKVIVADEPTSMLDVSIGIDIMNLMLDLKERHGLAYLLITHNLGSARYMADHIIVMFAGQVMESGPVEDIIANPKHPYTKLLLASSPDPWRGSETSEPVVLIDPQGLEPSAVGCSFQHRCPYVVNACRRDPIAIRKLEGRREVRCIHIEGSMIDAGL
jgi:peptide/nickel transport system ATP-binding protein